MRVALIADIHGNLVALDAVLAELDREKPDRVVCLGDVAALGPQPREVIARLRDLEYPVVTGNGETWLLALAAGNRIPDLPQRVADIFRWCAGLLSSDEFAYLRSFRPTIEVPLPDDRSLLCFHGSPHSDTDRLLATTPDEELDGYLVGHRAAILAGGHTHLAMVRRHRDTVLVNPGTVGLPVVQPALPWAEYALLTEADGRSSIDLRRVRFDVDAVRRAASVSGMPHGRWWVDGWA